MTSSKCPLILDAVFERHSTPLAHPERPDRIQAIRRRLEASPWKGQIVRIEPAASSEDWIRAIHSDEHWRMIVATEGKPHVQLDSDTFTGPESFEVAMLAAGSSVSLVKELLEGRFRAAFGMIRPPGHHAESRRPMGFCLFNNVAVAANWAVRQGGLRNVAVIDFDVHHGNGTQEIFYERSDVLYISQHQFPLYPGTGKFSEAGEGEGTGFSLNFPIPAGMGDFFYVSLFQEIVLPVLRLYRPELILVSAGFDAHRRDPLAGMKLTEVGFGRLANLLNQTAEEVSGGRIIYLLEGGYDLEALAESVHTVIETTLQHRDFDIDVSQQEESVGYQKLARRHLSGLWGF